MLPKDLADRVADGLKEFRAIDGMLRRDMEKVFTTITPLYAARPTPAPVVDAADQDLRIATALIAQLPSEHEGRNSWMVRYGEEKT